LDTLTGSHLNIAKSEIASVNQLNYWLIKGEYSFKYREGSSPGVLGTFNLLAGPFYGFFLSLFYLSFWKRIFSILFDSFEFQLSLLGSVIVALLFLAVFQSPIDYLLIFDNSFIDLMLIFMLSFYALNLKNLQQE
tara:strand:+ start:185 stop:589 length:405 start_codon:yes stop_codon:yes gene_type:complete